MQPKQLFLHVCGAPKSHPRAGAKAGHLARQRWPFCSPRPRRARGIARAKRGHQCIQKITLNNTGDAFALVCRISSSVGNISTKQPPARSGNAHSRAILSFNFPPFQILQHNSIGCPLGSAPTPCFGPITNYEVRNVPEKLMVAFLKLMPVELLFF